MKIIVLNNQRMEVFKADTSIEEDYSYQKQEEFESYLGKEILKVEMTFEDNMTLQDYSNAIDNGDGDRIIKEQIITLK